MERATIEWSGLGPAGSQTLETLSDDLGATVSGFDASNLPIGSLRLRAGTTVELVDAHSNVPGKAAETLYVRSLVVPAGATLVTNGLRIYAETASITGTVSNVADIIILPDAPACPADLNDDGFVDGYDLSIMLGFWNTNPTSMPQADINADGVVNAIDLGFVLAGWGACGE